MNVGEGAEDLFDRGTGPGVGDRPGSHRRRKSACRPGPGADGCAGGADRGDPGPSRHAASGSHDVVLEDVFAPDDNAVDLRLPAEWVEKGDAMAARVALMFATVYDGVARAARDWFIRFLHDRKPTNLGAALAKLPHIQAAAGEIDALLLTNRVLFGLATSVDAGAPPPAHEVYLARHTINANAVAAVEKMLPLAGNPGLSRAIPLERHLRDVLCGRVHSPQSDSVLGTAGRIALGFG